MDYQSVVLFQRAERMSSKMPRGGVRPPCSIKGCPKPHKGHGYCEDHLRKWKRRGDPLAGKITHCKHGHLYDEKNTYIAPKTGYRSCRTCRSFQAIEKNIRRRKIMVEGTLTMAEWRSVLEMYNYECVYCGNLAEQMDHFIALSRGGTHSKENVVPACAPCNLKKNNRDPLEFIGCGGVLV